MLTRDRLAVVGIIALLALPPAMASARTETGVAGHSVYSDMDDLDRCLAGIVGIARTRVMWFNDQVLFERNAPEGQNWVYAVQNGSASPLDATLTPTGEVFAFTDPNGVDWQVTEYRYTSPEGSPPSFNQSHVNAGIRNGEPYVDDDGLHEGNLTAGEELAWVVRIGPTTDDFSIGSRRPYNFVNLVDTCKFDQGQRAGTWVHDDASGSWTSSEPSDTTHEHHLPGDGRHEHGAFAVDLYLGPEPRLQPVAQAGHEYLGEVS